MVARWVVAEQATVEVECIGWVEVVLEGSHTAEGRLGLRSLSCSRKTSRHRMPPDCTSEGSWLRTALDRLGSHNTRRHH